MKKLFLILYIVFNVLSLVGAIYVIMNRGTVNAGYAVVPMVLSFACLNVHRLLTKKEQ